MTIRSCAWSASCSIEVSAAPGTRRRTSSVCLARARSSPRSGPLMMTARSAEDPVTISVAVSMIGWVKLNAAPGILALSRRDSSSTSAALVRPGDQVSYGRRSTSSSLRFGPNGSVPESLRPVWDATRLTSGDCRMRARIWPRDLGGLLERDAGREIGADPDDALVELGEELGSQGAAQVDGAGDDAGRLPPPSTARGPRRRRWLARTTPVITSRTRWRRMRTRPRNRYVASAGIRVRLRRSDPRSA